MKIMLRFYGESQSLQTAYLKAVYRLIFLLGCQTEVYYMLKAIASIIFKKFKLFSRIFENSRTFLSSFFGSFFGSFFTILFYFYIISIHALGFS